MSETISTPPLDSSPSPQSDTTAYISAAGELVWLKRRNLFLTSAVIGFTGMLFQFTVVFFFTLQLKSVALVGAFLAVGNVFSLIMDVPVGCIKKYFAAKTMYLIAGSAQLLAGAIFLKFILKFAEYVPPESGGLVASLIGFVFGDLVNILLLILCSLLYGFAKEVNDITTLSYILDNASPDEYAGIASTNNICIGLGSIVGLILSGVLLSADKQFFAIVVLVVVIACMMLFVTRFFDRADTTIDLSQIQSFKVLLKKDIAAHIKDYAVAEIKKVDLAKIVGQTKYVFLKPMEVKSTLDFAELKKTTLETFQVLYRILSKKPAFVTLYWSMFVVLTFGFWDTVAATFLVDFLNQVKSGWSYILLGCLAIPAFGLQWVFIGLSKKMGSFPLVVTGTAISGASLVVMGFMGTSLIPVMVLALLNSAGYAMGMALSQEAFLTTYNEIYAKELSLKEIESNASAAPMKMLQNMANVIGLLFGWMLIWILDFGGLFIFLGIAFLVICALSISRKWEIKV